MRTTPVIRVAARRARATLVGAVAALLMVTGALLGSTAAMAEDGKTATEEIAPEEYPPPPKDEKTVPPKPPVDEPELVQTGVGLNWQWVAASGLALLAVGGTLVLVRRRLTHD